MPAKSIQKPREQKNSSGVLLFGLASDVSVFHVSDFLPLLRRVIRKSGIRALEQFLLTLSNSLESHEKQADCYWEIIKNGPITAFFPPFLGPVATGQKRLRCIGGPAGMRRSTINLCSFA